MATAFLVLDCCLGIYCACIQIVNALFFHMSRFTVPLTQITPDPEQQSSGCGIRNRYVDSTWQFQVRQTNVSVIMCLCGWASPHTYTLLWLHWIESLGGFTCSCHAHICITGLTSRVQESHSGRCQEIRKCLEEEVISIPRVEWLHTKFPISERRECVR